MVRLAIAALAFGIFSAASIAADEKPSGKWIRSVEGIEITFDFGKDAIIITVQAGDSTINVTNSYTKDADGTYKLKITKVDEKGNFPDKPAVGLETSFKWKVDGKKATLSDFKGVDEAKGALEGEYAAK